MRATSFCVTAFVCGALFFGCAKPENRAVARVGERTISVGQIQDRLKSKTFSSFEDELAQKRTLLDSMIDEELMIMGAIEAGMDKDPDFLVKIKDVERRTLLEALYNTEILEKSTPSEKEMKEHYERMSWEVKASHILVETEETAQEIAKQLAEGADFAEMAKEKSTDRGTKDKGGDLGYFSWGRMVSPFQDTAFAMQVGTISKPLESQFGWHIIKLEDRRQVQTKDFAEEKAKIERTLSSANSKRLGQEYVTKVKEKANIQLDPEVVQVVLNKFLAKKLSAEDFTQEEKEMTLVTFQGGSWTVDYFLAEMEKIPSMYRPRVKDTDDLQALVRNILTGHLLEGAARKKGFSRKKDVVETIDAEKNRALLQVFQQKGVPTDTTITDEHIQAYYQDHIDIYSIPEQVKVQEIQLITEEEANDILKQLRRGADFGKLAREKSMRKWAAKKDGDLGYLDRKHYPSIANAAFDLKIGELGGPIKESNKYSVIKVLGKKPSQAKPLEDLQDNIRVVIERERQKDAVKIWLEEMRQQKGVEIFTDVLESTVVTPKKEAEAA